MSITKLKTYDERNSSFELMRMILMFMIVVHHGIVHGLGLSELGLGDNAQWHINMLASELNCFMIIFGLSITIMFLALIVNRIQLKLNGYILSKFWK